MGTAEHFPLQWPGNQRRAFGTDESTRRMARVARWERGARILDLGSTAMGVLVKEIGCKVTAAALDDASMQELRAQVAAAGWGDAVSVRQIDLAKLPFAEAEFDGIVLQNRLVLPFETVAQSFRRHLAPHGRLCVMYPVRVGTGATSPQIGYWEGRLGESLRSPRECLQTLEKAGYEPEAIEVMDEFELDTFYRSLETSLGSEQEPKEWKQQIALHKGRGNGPSVSFGFSIARRKEPGEKPPAARDSG